MDVPWDAVHAHASDNTIDGLNEFDGSFGGHLFHGDPGLAWHGLWAGGGRGGGNVVHIGPMVHWFRSHHQRLY